MNYPTFSHVCSSKNPTATFNLSFHIYKATQLNFKPTYPEQNVSNHISSNQPIPQIQAQMDKSPLSSSIALIPIPNANL